jgi:hypothetical protein
MKKPSQSRAITEAKIHEIFARPDVVRALEQNDPAELLASSALALADLADALGKSSVKLMMWECFADFLSKRGHPIRGEVREYLMKHADEIRPEFRAKLLKPDHRLH